jgi:C_GCAxxG_C_C family probable redox protein
MDRFANAKELFLNGHNCAQSVLLSFADELKYSRELALKIFSGFGGGMGKTQGTCGAVTGAMMVLGIKVGETVSNNDALMASSNSAVKDLSRRFSQKFGTTSCRELTGCDLNTQEGAEKFKEENIKTNVCAGCVEEAVRIVESLTE